VKESIYSIPIIDALNENSECCFCSIHSKEDQDAVKQMMGAAYMEDDIRMEVNSIGFCSHHFRQTYNVQNRLGLSLMVHTHLQQINKDLSNLVTDMPPKSKGKISFLGKVQEHPYIKLTEYLNNIDSSCYICNKVENTMKRYIDTFFFMWKREKELIDKVKNCKGFCMHHFSELLFESQKALSGKEFKEFTDVIVGIQMENLKRIEAEIEWFVKKFDYRFHDEPYGNSKDALPRSIFKISSTNVE